MENDGAHLYLARHGRTALNAEGRLRGLADPPLDEAGLTQARALGAALASHRPARVISSPLGRARQTADLIAEAAGVPAETDERFTDRDYGPWTGHVKAEVVARWGRVDDAPGVEPLERVLDRARPAMDAVLDAAGGSPVVVVTHDAVIRALLAAIAPELTDLRIPTGCFTDLRRRDGEWDVLSADNVP